MKDKLKTISSYLLGVCVLFVAFVFTCVNFGSGPNDRTYYYIDGKDVYYSPPLMSDDSRPFAFLMFTQDAINAGFSPLDNEFKSMTDNDGIVYANPNTLKWVVRRDTRDYTSVSTITCEEFKEIADRRPDPTHRVAGGFQDWCGSLSGVCARSVWLKPASRMTANGTGSGTAEYVEYSDDETRACHSIHSSSVIDSVSRSSNRSA